MSRLTRLDQLSLGFMTFALFLGAGNLIFPPSAGLAAGEALGAAALGFLVTAVGLPLLTVVALARVGGSLDQLTAPLGRRAGLAIATAVFLAIGPLFATPRTAVVSYELALVPFFGDSALLLALYSVLYFALVIYLSLSPGKLVGRIGKFITPVLLLALVALGVAALVAPAGEAGPASGRYESAPWLAGFLDGYLTMDTLGAMVFGIVIVTSITSRGVSEPRLITRYTVVAGLIAALGLSLVYLALFYLGAGSTPIAAGADNGGQILAAYVQHVFGTGGSLLLALVIGLACLTTAVGLTTACAEFFAERFGWRYPLLVMALGGFSLLTANQGLAQLIRLSVPVLVALYPVAIVLVVLSLLQGRWHVASRVFRPVVLVTLFFGGLDGLVAAGLLDARSGYLTNLPLAEQSLAWVLPALAALVTAIIVDRYLGRRRP